MSRAKFPFASGPFGLGKDMNAGLLGANAPALRAGI